MLAGVLGIPDGYRTGSPIESLAQTNFDTLKLTALRKKRGLCSRIHWIIAELRVHHPEIFEWNWIRDIANSAKHPRLGDQARTVKNIGIKGAGHLSYGVAGGYDVPSGGYVSSEPVINLDEGKERKLIHIVLKFEYFWQTWFQEPAAAPPPEA